MNRNLGIPLTLAAVAVCVGSAPAQVASAQTPAQPSARTSGASAPGGGTRSFKAPFAGDAVLHLTALATAPAARAPTPARATPKVLVRDAPVVQFRGAKSDSPAKPGDTDCNSPAHWDGSTLYVFNSAGHPWRSSGPDVFHLGESYVRCEYDNQVNGGRWIECTWKADDGVLYGWYHIEPGGLCPGTHLTAPKIGAVRSTNNGARWQDLGIVLEAPPGTLNCATTNFYFAGGNGDFCIASDPDRRFIYFFISTYTGPLTEQGVSVARMAYADRDQPAGKVWKWRDGGWTEPGLGGHVTAIFPARQDWHRPDVDALWGPSVHWNHHLGTFVMLLNRAIDRNWKQEGVYVSFNGDLASPKGWTEPEKILGDLRPDQWYPSVIGLDAARHETDKLAGKTARLFVRGKSQWEVTFVNSPDTGAAPPPPQRGSFEPPRQWEYSAPLIAAEVRERNPSHAQKDPSVVFYDGQWHVFMTVKLPGKSALEYCSFKSWEDANASKRTILPVSNADYYCAPQVFFFKPHQKWYLIYQVGVPGADKMWVAYSTTTNIADPGSWTSAAPILDGGKDDPRKVGGLDYWIICDEHRAYLFVTSLDGRMWRLWTSREEFPRGFGHCELALEAKVFEASHTYKLKGLDQYLTIIEENGRRYYKAYLADRLDGPWTPLADSPERPFAGRTNVRPAAGVAPWTDNISHGELIRDGYDETLTLDPANLRFVFQGMWEKDKAGIAYGQFPWRVGMLTPAPNPQPSQ
jgi:hypothetical protein